MEIHLGTPIVLHDTAYHPPRVAHGIVRAFGANTAIVEFIDGPLDGAFIRIPFERLTLIEQEPD